MSKIVLKGMSWSHMRGMAPMVATADVYSKKNPLVSFTWDGRSLQDFESQPLKELAETYDVIVIDHPHLGEAVAAGLLLDLSQTNHTQQLHRIAAQSVGKSHISYSINGGQYALAIDAAAPVACYRPDLIQTPPTDWQQVISLAQSGRVAVPLRSPHALMMFFWIANALHMPIATDTEHLMADTHIAEVLDIFSDFTAHIPIWCYSSDPIALLDAMADTASQIAYCPHIYGYINYAHTGFRDNVILFDNIVPLQNGTIGGSVLGGTGIAVSALSKHQDIATSYAFEIASAPCQTEVWVQRSGQPGNKMAWTHPDCNAITHNFMHNTLQTLERAWVRPRYNGYLQFQTRSSDILCDFLKGDRNTSQTIQKLQHLYRRTRIL